METYRSIDEDSSFLKLPEVEGAAYVIHMWNEAGLMSSTGMGITPLTWLEIDAWMRLTGSKPVLWERLMIRELSQAYVAEYNAACAEKNRPEPFTYVPPALAEQREKVSNKLLDALRSMKRSPAGAAV